MKVRMSTTLAALLLLAWPGIARAQIVNTFGVPVPGVDDAQVASAVSECSSTFLASQKAPAGFTYDAWGRLVGSDAASTVNSVGGIDGYRNPTEYWLATNPSIKDCVTQSLAGSSSGGTNGGGSSATSQTTPSATIVPAPVVPAAPPVSPPTGTTTLAAPPAPPLTQPAPLATPPPAPIPQPEPAQPPVAPPVITLPPPVATTPAPGSNGTTPTATTWQSVQPIIASSCVACHPAFSSQSGFDAEKSSAAGKVSDRQMPPSSSSQGSSMSDQDRATLVSYCNGN